MTDLTPTQRAIRVIVAQHLPYVPVERASSYADRIHINEPLHRIGLTDGAYVAATLVIERTYGFEATDDAWERCKTAGDLAALVDEHLQAEVAA